VYDFERLGWRAPRPDQLNALGEPALSPGRVSSTDHGLVRVITRDGPVDAVPSGLMQGDPDPLARPGVGDWVALDPSGTITHVLPRETVFVRRAAGRRGGPQLSCANVDVVFCVTTCGQDLNPRRIERYLAVVLDGGAQPVVVLNKADLAEDVAAARGVASSAAPGVPVVAVSALAESHDALAPLAPWLAPGTTVALVGSSGVGKSTLTNRILGRGDHATAGVRGGDEKGRHTTTRRTLEVGPSGVILVDTPGMRALGLWHAEEGVAAVFEDIEALAETCRFRDCSHQDEPGCAIRAAVVAGPLDPARVRSHAKLGRELAFEASRGDKTGRAGSKKKWRGIKKAGRVRQKLERDLGLKGW
jgi:ribosome biogenesis GTPase